MSALVDELRAVAALTKPLVYTISVGSDGGFIEVVSLADYEAAVDALQSRLEEKEAAWNETRKAVASLNNENGQLRSRLGAMEAERDEARQKHLGAERVCDTLDNKRHAAEARVDELEKALAFTDEQAKKIEALLEPHVEWRDI